MNFVGLKKEYGMLMDLVVNPAQMSMSGLKGYES